MKTMLQYSCLVLALAAGTATSAHAGVRKLKNPPTILPPGKFVAPEVDPSMAITGLSLLAGSLAVTRARRKA